MERIIILFSLVFIISNSFALTINKIKVTGNTHTSAETILAFVPELQEKHEYSQEELDGIVKRGKERLDYTGWFYKADIYIAPSKEGPDFRNIVIEVQDGFLYRFDGGPIYGSFGMDNVYGSGENYLLTLGWNAQYAQFGSQFLTPDMFFNIGAGNMPCAYYSNTGESSYALNEIQDIGGMQEIGIRFDYDFALILSNSLSYMFSGSYVPLTEYDSIGLAISLDKRPDIYSSIHGYYLCALFNYFVPFETYYPFDRYEIQGETYFSIPDFDRLILALKIHAGYQDNNPGIYYPDYLKISLAGIDGIRTLNVPDLIGNAGADGHAELRWDFLHTSFFGILNMDFEVLTFFDCGEAGNGVQDLSEDNIQYAAGAGLRVFFRDPVYVPLRVEFGWDKYGDMSVFAGMEAPF